MAQGRETDPLEFLKILRQDYQASVVRNAGRVAEHWRLYQDKVGLEGAVFLQALKEGEGLDEAMQWVGIHREGREDRLRAFYRETGRTWLGSGRIEPEFSNGFKKKKKKK